MNRKYFLKFCCPFLAVVLIIGATSCTLFQPKHIIVTDSALNWVEITYLGTNLPSTMIRFSLVGSGSLQMRSGSSPRVLDDFASNTAHPNWDDFKLVEINLAPDKMKQIFQALVNRGVLEKEPRANRKLPVLPMAKISGRFNRERFFRHTNAPEILEVVTQIQTLVDHYNAEPILDSR
jgi:hypothetical protein